MPLPETFDDDYRGRSRALPEATMRMEHLRKTDLKAALPQGMSPAQEKQWRYQHYIKDYLRCIASMDENVGRLLDYLEQTGLVTNTIVIYTSDQGFFLGDHGWFDKRFMYEESLRMPLLVQWPGHIKAGASNDAMVMNIVSVGTRLDSSAKPLTLGAWCKPESSDGVVIAQGGASHGFALYLKDARPHFAIRAAGTLAVLAGREKLAPGQWVHLAAGLNARGELHLWVDGKDIGATAKSGPIAARPADKLEVGNDTGSLVSEYGDTTGWRGLLEDVRVYWGELEAERIESWAGK